MGTARLEPSQYLQNIVCFNREYGAITKVRITVHRKEELILIVRSFGPCLFFSLKPFLSNQLERYLILGKRGLLFDLSYVGRV